MYLTWVPFTRTYTPLTWRQGMCAFIYVNSWVNTMPDSAFHPSRMTQYKNDRGTLNILKQKRQDYGTQEMKEHTFIFESFEMKNTTNVLKNHLLFVQPCEYTGWQWTVYLQMVKMVTFTLYIHVFYHTKNELKKKGRGVLWLENSSLETIKRFSLWWHTLIFIWARTNVWLVKTVKK